MARRQKKAGKTRRKERTYRTRERCAGDNVDCVSKLGRNLESSSGPAIRDSFAETFKQTFKMSHPFPEHHHFGTQRLKFSLEPALSVQDETGQADAD